MSVTINVLNNEVVASISGEIDHHMAKGLREKIDFAAQSNTPETLVLDFGDVTFMDSSGIGLIMGRYKLITELGGKLHVANVPKHLQKIMKISGLEKLKIFDDNGGI